jgi:uncharacterized membrane protein YphA (DoxX/SURF4 family)
MNSIMDALSKAGRHIFALPLIMFGVSHFTKADRMVAMVPVPGGVFWVYFTGIALLAGAIGIVTNFKGLGPLAAFLTGVLVLVFAFTVHLPHLINAPDEAARTMPMISLLKDIGLAGGAWAIARLMKA